MSDSSIHLATASVAKSISNFSVLLARVYLVKSISNFTILLATASVAKLYHISLYLSGGNRGRAGGRPPPPPPSTLGENDKFSEILTYKRVKNSLFECKWGGLSEI